MSLFEKIVYWLAQGGDRHRILHTAPSSDKIRSIVSIIDFIVEKANRGFRERLSDSLEQLREGKNPAVLDGCNLIEQEVLGPDPYAEPHDYEDCFGVCDTCYEPPDHRIHNTGPDL